MRKELAASYLDLPVTAFIRAVACGELPISIWISGKERWSRAAIDAAINMLTSAKVYDWRADQPGLNP